MAVAKRRFSKEEIARRGEAIYNESVRGGLKPADDGSFVAIDIETGDYELGVDELTACDRLRARIADPQIWLVRVGSAYLHRFGGHDSQGQA